MVMWNKKEANQLPNVRCMDSSDEQPPVEKTVGEWYFQGRGKLHLSQEDDGEIQRSS